MNYIYLFLIFCIGFSSCKGDGSVQTQSETETTDLIDYQKIIDNSETPVVVDFWATWCGPCKIISPTIQDLAEKYHGQITVLKIDVDKNPEIAKKYNITALPSVVYFQNGEIIEKQEGAHPKKAYTSRFKNLLKL